MKSALRVFATLAATAALAGALAATAQAQGPNNYRNPGPAKTVKEAGGEACTVWRPATVSAKTPVIVWGNGRGQAPEKYETILSDLASWGFVVAAANTPNAGTGVETLACLDYLTAENAKAGDAMMGKLDLTKVGVAGHSMGGGGALNAARDPRIKATVAVLPYITVPTFAPDAISGQHAPLLIFSGTADTIAPPEKHQQPVFDGVKVPVLWATLNGATHMDPTTAKASEFAPVMVTFFRAQLMGDKAAAAWFVGTNCLLCMDGDWKLAKKNGA